jgi:hypothetical protein
LNLIKFPDKKTIADAMYEIGHAEIAACVHGEQPHMVLSGDSPSVESFWKKRKKFQEQFKNVLSVVLIGFSSPSQLVYEQKVLDAIVEEFGGEYIPEGYEPWQIGENLVGEYVRCGLSNRLFRIAGDFFVLGGFTYDSIDHSFKMSDEFQWPLIEEAVEKGYFVDDETHNDWVSSAQMGHFSETEPLIYCEHDFEAGAATIGGYVQTINEAIKRKMLPSWPMGQMHHISGPHMCNYNELVLKIKKALDPEMTSNPGYPLPPLDSQNK